MACHLLKNIFRKLLQCGAVIIQWMFSKILTTDTNRLPVSATYGVSFVSVTSWYMFQSKRLLNLTTHSLTDSVTVGLYAISYDNILHYNSTCNLSNQSQKNMVSVSEIMGLWSRGRHGGGRGHWGQHMNAKYMIFLSWGSFQLVELNFCHIVIVDRWSIAQYFNWWKCC